MTARFETEPHIGAEAPAARDRHWLNEERVRVYSWIMAAVFGAMFAVWLVLSLPDFVDPGGKPFGSDFMGFWSAAKLALAGQAALAFDEAAIAAVQHAALPLRPDYWYPFPYPPTYLLAVAPLGFLPYPAALLVFALGTAALWACLVRSVVADRRAWIVAAAAPAALLNLANGQNAFLTAALAGFALLALDRRPVSAGVLIGLLAIKPHLAVLFPLALLAQGRWRTIAAAALTVSALGAASLAAFGWETWAAFIRHLPIAQAMVESGAAQWSKMPSGYAFARSLGAPHTAAWALQGAAALVAAVCVWRAWRNPAAGFEARAATLLAGSLLVSPYLFYYDLVWATLAVGWLALLGLGTGFRRGEREIFLFVWVLPLVMPPVQMLTAVQLGFPALLLLLFAAARRAAPLTAGERVLIRRTLDFFRVGSWVTRERLLRWGAGSAIVSVIVLTNYIALHNGTGLTSADGDQFGGDFAAQLAAAKAGWGEAAKLAYDPEAFIAFKRMVTGPDIIRLYVYPPTATLFLLSLAPLPFVAALVVWIILGVGLVFVLLRRLVGWHMAALAVIGAPSAFFNLYYVQNGFFTAALIAGGLMNLGRHPVFAGICFGCLAYKPHLGMLLPFALAAGGFWRSFVSAGLTAAFLVLASLYLFGVESWAGFFLHSDLTRQILESASPFWPFMPTVAASARIFGAPVLVAYALQLPFAAIVAALTVLVWHRTGSIEIKSAMLTVAMFFATPYAWQYDTVILIFAAAWLGREGLRTGFLEWERFTLILLMLSPVLGFGSAALIGVPAGPFVLGFVLLVLVRRSLSKGFLPSSTRCAHADLR